MERETSKLVYFGEASHFCRMVLGIEEGVDDDHQPVVEGAPSPKIKQFTSFMIFERNEIF